jgi:hypothetical protein
LDPIHQVDEGALQLLVEMGKHHAKDMRIQLTVAQSLYGFANSAPYARQILDIGGGRYTIETHVHYTAHFANRGGMASKQIMTATAAVLSRLLKVVMADYTRNDRARASDAKAGLISEKERSTFDARAKSRMKEFVSDAFISILDAVDRFPEVKEHTEHALDFFTTIVDAAAIKAADGTTLFRDYLALVVKLVKGNTLFQAVIKSGACHVYSKFVKNKCAKLLHLFTSSPGLISVTFGNNAMKALTDAQNYYKKRAQRQVLLVSTLELIVNFYTSLAASQAFAEKLDYGGGLSVTMSVLRSSPTAEFRAHNAQAMRLMLRTIEMEHLSYTLPVVGTPSVLSVLRHEDNLGDETMQSLGCRVIMLLTDTDQDTNTVVASGGLDVVAHVLAAHHSGAELAPTQAALATYATQTLAKLAAHPQGSSEIMRRATELVAGLLDTTARTVMPAITPTTPIETLAVEAAVAAGSNPAEALRLAALQLFEQLTAAEGARALAGVEARAAKIKAAAAAAQAAAVAGAAGAEIALLDLKKYEELVILDPKDKKKGAKAEPKVEVKPQEPDVETPRMTIDDTDGDAEQRVVPPLRGTELNARMLTYVCRALAEGSEGGNERVVTTACSVLRLCGTAWADAPVFEAAAHDAPMGMGAEVREIMHEAASSEEERPLDGFSISGDEKQPVLEEAERSEVPACHEMLRLGALPSLMQVAKLGDSTTTHAMRSIVQVFTALACDAAACTQLEQAGVISIVQRVMISSSTGLSETSKKAKISLSQEQPSAPPLAGGWESADTPSDSALVVLCLRFFASCLAAGYRGKWSTSVADLIKCTAGSMNYHAQTIGVQMEATAFVRLYLRTDRKQILPLLSDGGAKNCHVLGCVIAALGAHGAADDRVVCAGVELLAELQHCCCGRMDEPQYSADTSELADHLIQQPPSGQKLSLLQAAVAQASSPAGLACSRAGELLLLTIRGSCDPISAAELSSASNAESAKQRGGAYVEAGAVAVVVAVMARHATHARLLGSAVEAMRLLGLSSPVAAADMVRAGGLRVLSHAYAVAVDDTDEAAQSNDSSSGSAGRVCVLRAATSLLQQASKELGVESESASSGGYHLVGHPSSTKLESELGISEWMSVQAAPKPIPVEGEEAEEEDEDLAATDEGSSDSGSAESSPFVVPSAEADTSLHWWESMLRTACATPSDFSHSTHVLQLCGALFGTINSAASRAKTLGPTVEWVLGRYLRLQLTLGVQLMPLMVLLLQQHEHASTKAGTEVANGAMQLTTMLLRLQERSGIPPAPPVAASTPTAKFDGKGWSLVDEPTGSVVVIDRNRVANVCAAVLETGGMGALMKVHSAVGAMYSSDAASTSSAGTTRPELKLMSGALQALSSLARQCTANASTEADREAFGDELRSVVDGTWDKVKAAAEKAAAAAVAVAAASKGKGKGKGKAKEVQPKALSRGGSKSAGFRGGLLGQFLQEIAEVMTRFGADAKPSGAELNELRVLAQSTLLFVACCNRWVSMKALPEVVKEEAAVAVAVVEEEEVEGETPAKVVVEVVEQVDPASLIPPMRLLVVDAGAVEVIVGLMACAPLADDARLQQAGGMCLRDLTCERGLVQELASREGEYVRRLKAWGVMVEETTAAATEEGEEVEVVPDPEGVLMEAIVRCSLKAHAAHAVATPTQLVAMLASMAVDLTELPDALDESGNRKGFVDAKTKRAQVVGVAPGLVRGGALTAVVVWLGGQRFLPAPQLESLGFEAPADAQLATPVQEQALQVLVALAEAGDGEHIHAMLEAGTTPVLGALHVQYCALMGEGEGSSDSSAKAAAKNATNVLLLLMGVKEAAGYLVDDRKEANNPLYYLNRTLLQHPAELEHTVLALKMFAKVGRTHTNSAGEAAELSAAGCIEAMMGCIYANTSTLEVQLLAFKAMQAMNHKSFALTMELVEGKAVEALSLAYYTHQPESKDAMTRDLQQLHGQIISTIISILSNLADAERRADSEAAQGATKYAEAAIDAAMPKCISALCEVSLHAGKKGPIADAMSHDDGFGCVCKTLLDMRRMPLTAFECMTFMVRQVKAAPEAADKLIVGSASKSAIAMMTYHQEQQKAGPMENGVLQSLGSKVLQLLSTDDRNVRNMVAEGALTALTGALATIKSPSTATDGAPTDGADAALTVPDSEIARATTSCLLRMLTCDPSHLGGDGTSNGHGAMVASGSVEAVIATMSAHAEPDWAEHTALVCRLLQLMVEGEHGPLLPMASLLDLGVLRTTAATLGHGVCEPKPHIQACNLVTAMALAMVKALDEAEEEEGKHHIQRVNGSTLVESAAKWATEAQGAATAVVRGFMRAYGPEGTPKRVEVLQASVKSAEALHAYMTAVAAHSGAATEPECKRVSAKAAQTCQSAAAECKEFSVK